MIDQVSSPGRASRIGRTIPARSDTVLVTSTGYNTGGEARQRIDPKATETQRTLAWRICWMGTATNAVIGFPVAAS